MRYAVIIEKDSKGCSAYVPDLPGCIAAGDTLEEVRTLIADAIQMHLEGMREDGEPVPEPTSLCEYVETKGTTAA
jgi:predicted RNase H-like HicB family nuclease